MCTDIIIVHYKWKRETEFIIYTITLYSTLNFLIYCWPVCVCASSGLHLKHIPQILICNRRETALLLSRVGVYMSVFPHACMQSRCSCANLMGLHKVTRKLAFRSTLDLASLNGTHCIICIWVQYIIHMKLLYMINI